MMLDHRQRVILMRAAHCGIRAIDGAIRAIKDENPSAFHSNETLRSRIFYHEPPAHTPCRGFVRAGSPD
jgi:hypothetical protein